MSEIPAEIIDCQPEFAATLGLSVEATKALSLREMSDRAFERGLELTVTWKKAENPGAGRLRLSVGHASGDVTAIRQGAS